MESDREYKVKNKSHHIWQNNTYQYNINTLFYTILLMNISVQGVEKRHTARWYWFIQHPELGKCAILCQEFHGRYWLFGGWIDNNDPADITLLREYEEELWRNHTVTIKKDLWLLETQTSIHHIFVLELAWSLEPKPSEIKWFCFYPLEDWYDDQRKALEKNMDPHAKIAMNNIRKDNAFKEYPYSTVSIWTAYIKKFQRELVNVLT